MNAKEFVDLLYEAMVEEVGTKHVPYRESFLHQKSGMSTEEKITALGPWVSQRLLCGKPKRTET